LTRRSRYVVRMKNVIALALSIATLGGCSNKFDKAVSEMGDWADKMCACSDKDCADTVSKEWREWRGATKRGLKGEKPSKDQEDGWLKNQTRLEECRGKFRADKPATAEPAKP
jgi:hypothetical protein